MRPDRVVVGVASERARAVMSELYAPFVRAEQPVLFMDLRSAELTKYAANAMLATRISFMNEMATLCERLGADVDQVRRGIGSDRRIGHPFLFPGVGFGGSCLAGEETVLVRSGGRTRLVALEELFDALATRAGGAPDSAAIRPSGLEVLAWRPGASAPELLPVEAVTRRPFDGEAVLVRTKMGRRVLCTPDHPFLAASKEGDRFEVRPASALTRADWLPLATGSPRSAPPRPLWTSSPRSRSPGSSRRTCSSSPPPPCRSGSPREGPAPCTPRSLRSSTREASIGRATSSGRARSGSTSCARPGGDRGRAARHREERHPRARRARADRGLLARRRALPRRGARVRRRRAPPALLELPPHPRGGARARGGRVLALARRARRRPPRHDRAEGQRLLAHPRGRLARGARGRRGLLHAPHPRPGLGRPARPPARPPRRPVARRRLLVARERRPERRVRVGLREPRARGRRPAAPRRARGRRPAEGRAHGEVHGGHVLGRRGGRRPDRAAPRPRARGRPRRDQGVPPQAVEADRPDRLRRPGRDGARAGRVGGAAALPGPRLLARGPGRAHLRHDRRPRHAQLLPEGRAGGDDDGPPDRPRLRPPARGRARERAAEALARREGDEALRRRSPGRPSACGASPSSRRPTTCARRRRSRSSRGSSGTARR